MRRIALLVLLLCGAVDAFAAKPGAPVVLRFGATQKSAAVLKVARAVSGARRSAPLSAEIFANDEMRIRVPSKVAGRPVWIAQERRIGSSATSLFQVIQAVEAAHSNMARSVSVVLDEQTRTKYGHEFLSSLFSAFEVDKIAYADAKGEQPPVAAADPLPIKAAAEPGRDSVIWSGASHPELAEGVAKRLKVKSRSLTRNSDGGFANVAMPSNPSGKNVLLVQTKRMGGADQLHDDLLEMLHAAWQAKRGGAARVTLVSPYLSYSRSDRKDTPGTMVGAAVMPLLMKRAGVDDVVFYSVHQAQEVGIFQALRMRAVHAAGELVLAERIASNLEAAGIDKSKIRVVAPDAGAAKRARVFARMLGEKLGVDPKQLADQVLIGNKERIGNDIKLRFDGDVKDATVVAIDDETASGKTMTEIADAAHDRGARQVFGAVSHLTGPAHVKVAQSRLDKLFVLDTLPQDEVKRAASDKVEVVGIEDHLARVLRAMQRGEKADDLLFYEHP